MMVASPRMQMEVLSSYTYSRAEVHDFEDWKDGFQLQKFLEILQGWADSRVHFFLQFQDVLSTPDMTANIQRLNHARDMLYELGKNLVFCVTPEVGSMIKRNAKDFYDYVRPPIVFADQLPKESAGKNAPTRMPDKSVGVAVELDLTRPDDELLLQANELIEEGAELRKALRYRDALTVFSNACAIREKVLTNEDPRTATAYFWIAYAYKDTGNYATALEYAQKAREIREKILPGSADTAASYNATGYLYDSMGDYETALEWYQQAREICEAVLGKEHPDTASTYNNIGGVYHHMGDYETALKWYQQAREIREAVLDKEHPDTAETYNNIGETYRSMGDYKTALEWFQQAREIQEAVLGKEHPDTASTYNNIGGAYEELHKYPKALEYYSKAEAIWKKVYGAEHPHMATLYNNLGTVYAYLRIFPTAEEYLLKALNIHERLLGTNHPDTAQTYFNLANLYAASGKHAKATLYHNKAKQNPVWQKRLNSYMGHRVKKSGGKGKKKKK